MTNLTADSTYEIPEVAPQLERGPQWLREARRGARETFNATPLPRRGLHLWRYTDPARFLFDKVSAADTVFDDKYDATTRTEIEHLDQGHLDGVAVDYGGRVIRTKSSDKLTSQGVVLAPLSQAIETHHDLIKDSLYALVNSRTGKFEALNGALWNDGVFVYVPDNVWVDNPIHLLHEAGSAGSGQFHRLLVVVGNNAGVTLIDEYGGGSDDAKAMAFANSAVEIITGDDSRTRYVSLQRHSRGITSYLTHRAQVGRGAQMLTIPLAFGGFMSKQNFGVSLNGPYAESDMYGLLFGTRRQHFDNHTLHHHAVGQTKSNIDFKVVLRDKAQSAYTGLIKIDPGAEVCEAYQENRNMLLNPGTRAETIPELEILNEEVTCSHGATVGPIDPIDVFYLQSRGIGREEAVRMIVSGFVASTLKLVPEDIRERIQTAVARRLEDV